MFNIKMYVSKFMYTRARFGIIMTRNSLTAGYKPVQISE